MPKLDDILGPKKRKHNAKKVKALDDILGPAPKKRKKTKTGLDDILGPARRKRLTYRQMAPPKTPKPGGIWALREAKGKNLGRTCIICKEPLKSKGGRPPVQCGKKACFRAFRNAYRKDYDAVAS